MTMRLSSRTQPHTRVPTRPPDRHLVKSRQLAGLIAILPLLISAGSPHVNTGNEFYSMCGAGRDRCWWYVQGVFDGLMSTLSIDQARVKKPYCLPSNSTTSKLRDTLVHFLANRPTERRKPLAALTHFAFAAAWPCNLREFRTQFDRP